MKRTSPCPVRWPAPWPRSVDVQPASWSRSWKPIHAVLAEVAEMAALMASESSWLCALARWPPFLKHSSSAAAADRTSWLSSP